MTTTIASRTPEGNPARCPLCGHEFQLDPSWPGGDAPCPACNNLVWIERPASLMPEADKEACVLKQGTMRFGRLPVRLREAFRNAVEREGADSLAIRLLDASSWQDLLQAR